MTQLESRKFSLVEEMNYIANAGLILTVIKFAKEKKLTIILTEIKDLKEILRTENLQKLSFIEIMELLNLKKFMNWEL